MQIQPKDLNSAAQSGVITTDQAQKLWAFWQKDHEDVPSFRFVHVLYYFGGILAITAITLFVTQAWDFYRGWPLFFLTTLFFILGLLFTRYFIKKDLNIPAGIMATFSLAVVPLAVYNFQLWLGLVPGANYQYSDFNFWVSWYWVPMELVTLLIGAIMFYIYDFPFLLLPISAVLWYLSMDLWVLLINSNMSFSSRAEFSMIFGLVMLACAIYLDFTYNKNKKDYAFWLYIFGVMTFWGGLTCMPSTGELGKFFYCMINVGMIFVGVLLNRRVFTVFGAIGVLIYLGHLASSIFADSLGFPAVLIFLGIMIIFLATRWPRIENKLVNLFAVYIPEQLMRNRNLH